MKLTSKELEHVNDLESLTTHPEQIVKEILESLFVSLSMKAMRDVSEHKKSDGRSVFHLPYIGKLTLDYKSIPPKDLKSGWDIDLTTKFEPSRHLYDEMNHIIHGKMPPTWKRQINKFKKTVNKDLEK
jgi:hypothetical protein